MSKHTIPSSNCIDTLWDGNTFSIVAKTSPALITRSPVMSSTSILVISHNTYTSSSFDDQRFDLRAARWTCSCLSFTSSPVIHRVRYDLIRRARGGRRRTEGDVVLHVHRSSRCRQCDIQSTSAQMVIVLIHTSYVDECVLDVSMFASTRTSLNHVRNDETTL